MKTYISGENKNGRIAFATSEPFIYDFFKRRKFENNNKKEVSIINLHVLKREMEQEVNRNHDFEKAYINLFNLIKDDLESDDIIKVELE